MTAPGAGPHGAGVPWEGASPGAGHPRQRRLAVFANPAAGRTRSALGAAVAVFSALDMAHEVHWPTSRDELGRGIREAAGRCDGVVLAGGDGTVNAALPALIDTGAPLGLLPVGTANDLARTLGVPNDPAAAARVIAKGAERALDVGRVNQRLFCNVAHIGFGVHAHSEGMSAGRKRRWRALSYPVSLARAVGRLRPFSVEVHVDRRVERLRTLHFSVGNGRFYGGGVPVQAAAVIDDGLLDAYAVPPHGPLGLARAVWDVWRGGAPGRAVWRSAARRIEVRTRRPRRIMADGEYLAWTPATFEVLPGALRAVVPLEQAGPGISGDGLA